MILKRVLIVLALFCGVVTVAWIWLPRPVASALIALNTASAGLEHKTVSTNHGEINYLEGGTGETLLLIHGIYARKEHWVELARDLVADYRVIALDLPGFGDNALRADESYLIGQQAEALGHVMDALGIAQAHIAANSMGAYVTAVMIAQDPTRAESFAFIGSPLGVPTPTPSDMDIARAQGHTPLVVQTREDFVARNAWLAPTIPYVPAPILSTWMQDEVAQGDHNVVVWDVVHHRSTAPSVLELAPSLTIPAFVLWCQQDRIFHVSGAPVLADALPDADVVVLDGCGHVPMLDQPSQVAKIYRAFLAGLSD